MTETAVLRPQECRGRHVDVDDEATTLVLETLFDIRAAVYELHDVLIGGDDEEKEEDA